MKIPFLLKDFLHLKLSRNRGFSYYPECLKIKSLQYKVTHLCRRNSMMILMFKSALLNWQLGRTTVLIDCRRYVKLSSMLMPCSQLFIIIPCNCMTHAKSSEDKDFSLANLNKKYFLVIKRKNKVNYYSQTFHHSLDCFE